MSQEYITQSVHPELVDDVEWVDDVTDRFAHLLSARVYKAVVEDAVGGLHRGRHEHRLPHERLEAYLVLPCYLERRPLLPKLLEETVIISRPAEGGNVVSESIKPNIHHLCLVAWYGDTPREARLLSR